MKLTVDNRSRLSTAELYDIVEFLEPCFADLDKPVHLTIVDKRGTGIWGKAYYPTDEDRRVIKAGAWSIKLFVGKRREKYPYSWTYKKRAGPVTCQNESEALVHILAHEMRHVEQFASTETQYPDWKSRDTVVYKRSRRWGKMAIKRKMRFRDIYRIWCEHHCPGGSEEVDAELVAHAILKGWLRSKDPAAKPWLPAVG